MSEWNRSRHIADSQAGLTKAAGLNLDSPAVMKCAKENNRFVSVKSLRSGFHYARSVPHPLL